MATNRTMSSTGKGLGGVDGAPREEKKVASALTSKDLTRQAAAQHAEQAFEIVKQQLKATLVDYADRVRISARRRRPDSDLYCFSSVIAFCSG